MVIEQTHIFFLHSYCCGSVIDACVFLYLSPFLFCVLFSSRTCSRRKVQAVKELFPRCMRGMQGVETESFKLTGSP